VDAASGGFVAPFLYPELVWDFRLPLVKSINVSGHKYGLVYAGIGWVVWRSKEDLPEELVFHVNYLGADQPTFTLNFSKGGFLKLRLAAKLAASCHHNCHFLCILNVLGTLMGSLAECDGLYCNSQVPVKSLPNIINLSVLALRYDLAPLQTSKCDSIMYHLYTIAPSDVQREYVTISQCLSIITSCQAFRVQTCETLYCLNYTCTILIGDQSC
jgi:hypothetical protein